jgi:hypothetical protein
MAGGRRKGFRSVGRSEPGSPIGKTPEAEPSGRPPGWETVEQLLSRLASTRAVFPTAVASSNWISAYEPGRRLLVESGTQSHWVQVEHIRACWDRFEELGRISRRDVLEPGRRSAFMMALFAQLAGVRPAPGKEPQLVLPSAGVRPSRQRLT